VTTSLTWPSISVSLIRRCVIGNVASQQQRIFVCDNSREPERTRASRQARIYRLVAIPVQQSACYHSGRLALCDVCRSRGSLPSHAHAPLTQSDMTMPSYAGLAFRTKPAWTRIWHLWSVAVPRRSITGRLVHGRVLRRYDGRKWIYKKFDPAKSND
jgi:hypothetical protein